MRHVTPIIDAIVFVKDLRRVEDTRSSWTSQDVLDRARRMRLRRIPGTEHRHVYQLLSKSRRWSDGHKREDHA